ncbi:hypothetical protein LH447_02775 [Laribacter hongkongensis]|uniref:YqiA/YcfP family alpha/beta fold hydrolase n=1 Tax=Laribacter hongkongensis TaxID=168471 RepID=UPI001EFEDE83|nr:YqiA/YcfP family alpha/beta fold hydrolase [Laribacter hongkongensis]MCG9052027.1 hypothetical protein [Laribacter hongkongensis]
MIPHFVYLHGFLSSPASAKAECLRRHLAAAGLADRFHAPVLPVDPLLALLETEATLVNLDGAPFVLVGSSLGGFYAEVMAERWQAPAVLVNPAVHPWRHAGLLIGKHTHYHSGAEVEVTPAHLATLAEAEPARITPALYWLLACTGDEVLDWQAAASRFAGCRQTVREGGDHGFPWFADYLDDIVAFAVAATQPCAQDL